MRRAFTLVEMLTVMAVVAVLAALLFPVFRAARMSARHTQTMGNLHQLGLAIALYRQEAEGGGLDEGTPEAMGLPMPYGALFNATHIPGEISQCTSGQHRDEQFYDSLALIYAGWSSPPWSEVTHRYHENSIMIAAMCFSDPNVPLGSLHFIHHGIGLAVSGAARVVERKGDWMDQAWWQP